MEDDHLTIHRLHMLQALYTMFKNYIHKYLANLLIVKILLQPNFSSTNKMVICNYICLLHCSSLMSVGPQKCSLVWHNLKHGLVHKSTFWTLKFCSFVFSQRHIHQILFPSKHQSTLYHTPHHFGWFKDGACLLCCLVWGKGILPAACIRFFTTVSLIIMNHKMQEWWNS